MESFLRQFMDLKRGSTGLGWDPRRKTIDAPDEWWKEKLEVVPNAKKFRYCGINPELEHKLDSMFMGVIATGVHAWTPNQGIDHENFHGDTEKLDATTDSFEDPSQSFDSISECSQFKQPSSTTSTGSRKKKFGSGFLRSQITQLVNSCTNISSGTNSSQPIIEAPLLSAAIKILEQTTEAFEDLPLYLFSTKLLEDPIKREFNKCFNKKSLGLFDFCEEWNVVRMQDCIGAIDGTHVDARVSTAEKVAYIGRCGSTTQNVMAVCDFNMCFTFVMSGWEGSAHDSRIFKFAIRNQQHKFPMPPPNKYYLVDAGYPMQRGFLKPFSDTKYHIPDFQRASQSIRGRKEAFNKRHSSLRGVIERSFGVWKKKWVILRDMPTYPFKKQVKIVVATMALHNYIRRHPSRDDPEFKVCDEDHSYIPPEAYEYRIGQSLIDNEGDMTNHEAEDGEGAEEMIQLREQITSTLVNEMN
ncbi:hypothetical protein KFK09_007433 [Dendrobium nobile]|uniref:DDE Tnp4 domain-containing protein n=1 Tax=Dendrobium nobile TaxID=94219 RepID=A0A8T3BU33_DENNO|nr:hypothetical protein KFK09_007433 [Dendrobium nobile]